MPINRKVAYKAIIAGISIVIVSVFTIWIFLKANRPPGLYMSHKDLTSIEGEGFQGSSRVTMREYCKLINPSRLKQFSPSERLQIYRDWISQIDLTPVAVPELHLMPTNQEHFDQYNIAQMNTTLSNFAEAKRELFDRDANEETTIPAMQTITIALALSRFADTYDKTHP